MLTFVVYHQMTMSSYFATQYKKDKKVIHNSDLNILEDY